MKLTEKMKKNLAIVGGVLIGIDLIAAIGMQFGLKPSGEEMCIRDRPSTEQDKTDKIDPLQLTHLLWQMCIRDSPYAAGLAAGADHPDQYLYRPGFEQCGDCLLYTSRLGSSGELFPRLAFYHYRNSHRISSPHDCSLKSSI